MGGSGGGISGVSGYRNTVGTETSTPGTQISGYAFGKGNDNTQKVMNGYAKYKSDIEQVKDYFDEYDKSISNI